jgi:hypothetical protein
MIDFMSGFKRPFLSGKKLLIGFLLSILPIVNWFAMGYFLEASGLTKRKYKFNKMPEWNNWGELFVNGLLASITGIIYLIPAAIVFIIAIGNGLSLLAQMSALSAKGGVFALFSMIFTSLGPLVALGGLLGLLALFLAPMAILHYIAKGSFAKIFDFKVIFKKAFTATYFVPWLVAMIVSGILGFILGFIPFLGAAFAMFVTGTIMYTWLGQAYKQLK